MKLTESANITASLCQRHAETGITKPFHRHCRDECMRNQVYKYKNNDLDVWSLQTWKNLTDAGVGMASSQTFNGAQEG